MEIFRILFAKVTIFAEQSCDAWEREGGWRSGGSGSVGGKQLNREGSGGQGETGTAVKMEKHKGWPDHGSAGRPPVLADTVSKLGRSGLCFLTDSLSVKT